MLNGVTTSQKTKEATEGHGGGKGGARGAGGLEVEISFLSLPWKQAGRHSPAAPLTYLSLLVQQEIFLMFLRWFGAKLSRAGL